MTTEAVSWLELLHRYCRQHGLALLLVAEHSPGTFAKPARGGAARRAADTDETAGRVTPRAFERLPLSMLRLLARHYRRQLALVDAETARRRP